MTLEQVKEFKTTLENLGFKVDEEPSRQTLIFGNLNVASDERALTSDDACELAWEVFNVLEENGCECEGTPVNDRDDCAYSLWVKDELSLTFYYK